MSTLQVLFFKGEGYMRCELFLLKKKGGEFLLGGLICNLVNCLSDPVSLKLLWCPSKNHAG